MLDAFQLPAPELVWGVFQRLLALVYVIAFSSLAVQVLPLHGSNGVLPFTLLRERMQKDFGWRRAMYFPTLLWIHSSDRMLRAIPLIGAASALYVLWGGPHTSWAFALCYLMFLSLDPAFNLIFPWDSMLFEAGLLAVLLPELKPLPELAAQAAPVPALAWVYQLLVFRVLLGFGRVKFLGSKSEDLGYLKGFLITQPLPSKIGWYFQKAPMWVLKASLLGMFIIEVPLPFLVFYPGILKVAASIAIALFMVAIWACGSFGYFSLIMIVLTVTWWDVQTPAQLSLSAILSPGAPHFINAVAAAHTLGALLSFPSNSLVANAWLNWSLFERIRPRILSLPIRILRALHPLRWVHAYGVFPPKTYAGVKIVPVLEATWDGKRWNTCEPNFTPVLPESPPRFVSPHHARGDTAALYEAFGVGDASVLGAIFGTWSPYGFGKRTGLQISMRRMLEGTLESRVLLKPSSFDLKRQGPPLAVRARLYMLEPASLEHKRATGQWWIRTLLGPHAPEMRLHSEPETSLPPPELWHWEHSVWQRRSVLGPLMKRAARGEDPHELALLEAPELDRATLEAFWSELVPFVGERDCNDWQGIEQVVYAARARWGTARLDEFERFAGRLGLFLWARLEPLFLEAGIKPLFGKTRPAIDVPSLYHLSMLSHHILCHGRAEYDAVFADPLSANAHAAVMTQESGHYLQALFRYDLLVMDAAKLRLLERYLEPSGREPIDARTEANLRKLFALGIQCFGSAEASIFLRQQFQGPEHVRDIPERWPTFYLDATGEVKPVKEAEGTLLSA